MISPRVDPYAVWLHFDLRFLRMTMHHDDAVIGFGREKGASDPAKVSGTLFLDRPTRNDARVDQKIVSEPDAISGPPQKGDVARWDTVCHPLPKILELQSCQPFGIHAVTSHGGDTAIGHPGVERVQITIDRLEHEFLMVTHED